MPEIIASAKLEGGKKIEDYPEWLYKDVTDTIDLKFDNDKLIVVKCLSNAKA